MGDVTMTAAPTDERVAIPCRFAKAYPRERKPCWSVMLDGTAYEYPLDAASFDGETLYLRRDLAERDGHVK